MYRNYWGLGAVLAPGALITLTLIAFDPTDALEWVLIVAPWTMGLALFFFPYRVDLRGENVVIGYVLRRRTRPLSSLEAIQTAMGPLFHRFEFSFRRGRLVIRENDSAIALANALLRANPNIEFEITYPGFDVP